jgi:hypothetical protein
LIAREITGGLASSITEGDGQAVVDLATLSPPRAGSFPTTRHSYHPGI